MDFRHISAFIAVADALSVTKAAERLHISQPPLSRHIHQLEEELGLTLFVRHRQGVTLTEAGRRLLEKARALDAAGTEFCETARQMARGEESRIRIGIGWGLWDVVNRMRVEFAKQHPDVTFEARDAYCSYDSDEQLRTRTLDVVFARPPFDEASSTSSPIFHERIQAIIARRQPAGVATGSADSRPGERAAAALGSAHGAGAVRPSARPVCAHRRHAADDARRRRRPVQPRRPDARGLGQRASIWALVCR